MQSRLKAKLMQGMRLLLQGVLISLRQIGKHHSEIATIQLLLIFVRSLCGLASQRSLVGLKEPSSPHDEGEITAGAGVNGSSTLTRGYHRITDGRPLTAKKYETHSVLWWRVRSPRGPPLQPEPRPRPGMSAAAALPVSVWTPWLAACIV